MFIYILFMYNFYFPVKNMYIVLTPHILYSKLIMIGDDFMATTNVTIRIDEELKKQAEDLFSDLGLNMTTAFISFIKQSVREQRIPFILSRNIPNEETRLAIQEVQEMKKNSNKKTYDSFSELVEEVQNEI